MHLEVELKFPVASLAAVRQQLAALGAEFAPLVEQADTYFAHPARDFSQTDEALRLRRVGEQTWITYKGPKLDAATKTRRELELPLPSGPEVYARHADLLTALGFRAVATVRKRREAAHLLRQAVAVEVALDDVEGVGQFVELEASADDADRETAQTAIASLAKELGLTASERRSYLELLLAGKP